MISGTGNFVNTIVIELCRNENRTSVPFESAFGSIDSVSVLFQVHRFEFGFQTHDNLHSLLGRSVFICGGLIKYLKYEAIFVKMVNSLNLSHKTTSTNNTAVNFYFCMVVPQPRALTKFPRHLKSDSR